MPSTRPLNPGEPGQIGDFRLTGVLGEGGQGVVYSGEAPWGGAVAVKVLHARLSEDPDARRRFLRESEVVRRVAPFCTARVLDVGFSYDRPYIVSEYVPGRSLDQVVRAEGPRAGGALDRLAVATATALAAIHRAGITHRDFKPSNVILGPEGPVVIDFGLSRSLEHTSVRTGLVGTPAYMAPEQYEGKVGQPADVFSWAATMVYAATGHRAFPGDSVPALLHAVTYREPDLSGVPDGLRDVVAACLAKNPSYRPTAATLLRTLTGDTLPPEARRSPSPAPHASPSPAPHASPAPAPHASPSPASHASPSSAPHASPAPAPYASRAPEPHASPAAAPPASRASGPPASPAPGRTAPPIARTASAGRA
ncbi:serine/threonine-protein kinase, partial [Sphaerisporangium aureirubrum]|uniref:serine/threonine-protein kinase n=1 Tax=Sphaerisporangium aureirubrum TaxID=1544736 RepID=UPI003634498E